MDEYLNANVTSHIVNKARLAGGQITDTKEVFVISGSGVKLCPTLCWNMERKQGLSRKQTTIYSKKSQEVKPYTKKALTIFNSNERERGGSRTARMTVAVLQG